MAWGAEECPCEFRTLGARVSAGGFASPLRGRNAPHAASPCRSRRAGPCGCRARTTRPHPVREGDSCVRGSDGVRRAPPAAAHPSQGGDRQCAETDAHRAEALTLGEEERQLRSCVRRAEGEARDQDGRNDAREKSTPVGRSEGRLRRLRVCQPLPHRVGIDGSGPGLVGEDEAALARPHHRSEPDEEPSTATVATPLRLAGRHLLVGRAEDEASDPSHVDGAHLPVTEEAQGNLRRPARPGIPEPGDVGSAVEHATNLAAGACPEGEGDDHQKESAAEPEERVVRSVLQRHHARVSVGQGDAERRLARQQHHREQPEVGP